MQPRKFADLRKRAGARKESVHSLAAAALKSIGATPQGDALREYLAFIVFDTSSAPNEGAWREAQARRKFAEEILNLMDGETNERDKDRASRARAE